MTAVCEIIPTKEYWLSYVVFTISYHLKSILIKTAKEHHNSDRKKVLHVHIQHFTCNPIKLFISLFMTKLRWLKKIEREKTS